MSSNPLQTALPAPNTASMGQQRGAFNSLFIIVLALSIDSLYLFLRALVLALGSLLTTTYVSIIDLPLTGGLLSFLCKIKRAPFSFSEKIKKNIWGIR